MLGLPVVVLGDGGRALLPLAAVLGVIPAQAYQRREPVGTSADLERILALPRRAPVDLSPGSARAEALVELMTTRLRRPDRPPGSACGCRALGREYCLERLLPVQAWVLWEAPIAGGVLASVTVGGGKTLVDILIAMVMPDCKVAALLIPPGLVEQFEADYLAAREHFRVPSLIMPGALGGHIVPGAPRLHVVPYSKLSRAEATVLLADLNPDLVAGDEIHNLKAPDAVRTGRFLTFFAEHPESRLAGWTGTLTADSIEDFTHLAAFALGEGSPVPLDPPVAKTWAGALDPSDWPAPAGELMKFAEPGESVVAGISRRLAETRGFIVTRGGSGVSSQLVLGERKPPPMPPEVVALMKDLRATWTRPDGEELVDALQVARCAREMACGFFYKWRFPDDPPREDVEAWFAARKAWHRELREVLKDRRPHMDSPLLCARAAIRFYKQDEQLAEDEDDGREETGRDLELPTWESEHWPRWRDLRDTVRHETETVWVSDWLVRDAVAWAASERGVVWYEHGAFGRALGELGGLPVHGGGPGAEARIRAEKGDRSIAASILAHGEGRDGLQYLFADQLVANPPASAKKWEQLLGRFHRKGQRADVVRTRVYRHTSEMADALDRALRLAKYIEGITGAYQKLLAADVEWRLA